jgi:energy-coupling factor transporter transmembrane protein EcfT
MALHPISHLIIALASALVVLTVPPVNGISILVIMLVLVLVLPSRTKIGLSGPFLKLFVFAVGFLLLIHAVRWSPPGFSSEGFGQAFTGIIRIGTIITVMLYLTRQITGGELYVFMTAMHIPPVFVLVMFRTLWLVPRFVERIDEVILAHRLRGMRIATIRDRIRAVLPSLTPIVASMLEETYVNAMTMTIRGYLEPGQKTHADPLPFRGRDIGAILAALSITTSMLVLRYF